jgi:hypothetical protein
VGGLAQNVFGSTAVAIQPGFRNQFNTGLQQAVGKFLLIDFLSPWLPPLDSPRFLRSMILPGILCRAVPDPSPLAVSDLDKGTAKIPHGSRPQDPCHPVVYPLFPARGPNRLRNR